MSTFPGTILVSDLETTGIDITKAGACQIAALAMRQMDDGSWNLEPLFQTYCSPSVPMPPEALAVHGITPEMYQYSPRDTVAVWMLNSVIESLKAPVILSGYNCTRYDYPLMEQLFPIANFSNMPQIDVMTLYLRLAPEKGLKLTEVFADRLNDANLLSSAHDAMADVTMTARLLVDYLKTYPTDPLVLAEWCNTPMQMEVMPWGKYKGKPFSDVPHSYLQWMAAKWTDMHPDLAKSLRDRGLM